MSTPNKKCSCNFCDEPGTLYLIENPNKLSLGHNRPWTVCWDCATRRIFTNTITRPLEVYE